MGLTARKEYHWIDGRVVPRTVARPSGFGPWPGIDDRWSSLVIAIEEEHGSLSRTYEGPAATSSLADCATPSHYTSGSGDWNRTPTSVDGFPTKFSKQSNMR